MFVIPVYSCTVLFFSVNAFTQSKSNIEQSTWKPERIDQPEYSSAWLKAFRTVNQSAIENVSLFVSLLFLQLVLVANALFVILCSCIC